MILEVAILHIKHDLKDQFVPAFQEASTIISKMKGYMKHELQQCLEEDAKYILLVQWESLEDHTVGFRGSEEYKQWKALLHHFYDPFPTVEHYVHVELK